jgi:hypothetical protein
LVKINEELDHLVTSKEKFQNGTAEVPNNDKRIGDEKMILALVMDMESTLKKYGSNCTHGRAASTDKSVRPNLTLTDTVLTRLA